MFKELKKYFIMAFALVALILGIIIVTGLGEINKEGHYLVKQSYPLGNMSVRYKPGWQWVLWGDITKYRKTGEVYLSKSSLDGGKGEVAQPVEVQFRDGSKAIISCVMKYRKPSTPQQILNLHADYTGDDNVNMILVRNQVIEAIQQAGPHFKAEQVYAARRAEFTALVNKQITEGIYAVDVNEIITFDADSNKFIDYDVKIRKDDKKEAIIEKASPFKKYGIEVISFVIKDIDFDKKIDELIAKKKEAEQKKVVAKAKAEEAKQQAITEYEQGRARVAKAKADKEVEKIAAVTEAQKKFEVEQFEAKKAIETAKKIEAEGRAKAAANRALVQAGLTPEKRAEIEKETAIGVAEHLSKWVGPKVVMMGGSGGKGSSAEAMMSSLAIKQMMGISKELGGSAISK